MAVKYGTIAGVDKPVSRIFCGTAAPQFLHGRDCSALLNGVLALGVNAFDTARVYGGAERSLGMWLNSCNVRSRVVILSKCAHPNLFGKRRLNERAIRSDLKKSLSALGTEYIDIYLAHRDDASVSVGEVVEVFNSLKSEGKIRAFGVSNWTHGRIAAANEYAYSHGLAPIALSSPQFSLAEQYGDPWGGGVSISGMGGAAARTWYGQSGMAVLAYSPLARGVLSGRISSFQYATAARSFDRLTVKGYVSEANFERLRRCEELAKSRGVAPSQVALAYIFCNGLNAFAAVSCSSVARMGANAAATALSLTAQECAYLNLSGN